MTAEATHTIAGGFRNGKLPVHGPLSARQIIGQVSLKKSFEWEVYLGNQSRHGDLRFKGAVVGDGTVTGTWKSGSRALAALLAPLLPYFTLATISLTLRLAAGAVL